MYIKVILFLSLFLFTEIGQATMPSFELDFLEKKIPEQTGKYYKKAQNYFSERIRPRRDFLDVGLGATVIESFYPFEMKAFPFYLYLNYRREKGKKFKTPLVFSLQYEMLGQNYQGRVHGLVGFRHPTSHDLTLFHTSFMAGASFPVANSFRKEKPGLEFRLLFTHIIGPKASVNRLYFQWGLKAQLTDKFKSGLVVQLGLDNYL